MVTLISAVPLFAFVAIVIALSAAMALARVLVNVTLEKPLHVDPLVLVSPVVVGRERVTPVTPLTEIVVEMLDEDENPLAE